MLKVDSLDTCCHLELLHIRPLVDLVVVKLEKGERDGERE